MKAINFLLALLLLMTVLLGMIVWHLSVQTDSIVSILNRVDDAYQQCHISTYPRRPDYQANVL